VVFISEESCFSIQRKLNPNQGEKNLWIASTTASS
jgi:hypothetical protein